MGPGAVVIVVGASAGGVETLRSLAGRLPRDFSATILVVLHLPAAADSQLAPILQRASGLPTETATNGARLEPGHIYVAPPDHHLQLKGIEMQVDRGPRVNGHRPAIDLLFRSAAEWFGPRAMGVVLSGMLDDGAAGLLRMRQAGAVTVAQDPAEAPFPDLPTAAIARGAATQVLGVEEIADLVITAAKARDCSLEEAVAMYAPSEATSDASVSPFTCPNCHGSLWEVDDGGESMFRCRIGHTYSIESLVEVSTSALDDALWAAYRALLEQADLCRRMARRMQDRRMVSVANRYETMAVDAERRAWVVHDALVTHELDESAETG